MSNRDIDVQTDVDLYGDLSRRPSKKITKRDGTKKRKRELERTPRSENLTPQSEKWRSENF